MTLGADQLCKTLVILAIAPGHSVPLIPGILHLTYVQNTGAAFGLFKGLQGLFVVLSLIVMAWIVLELQAKRQKDRTFVIGCALTLGGAAGNLLDRLRLGHVTDFLDLRVWPVFNIADSAITIGVILIAWYLITARPTRQKV